MPPCIPGFPGQKLMCCFLVVLFSRTASSHAGGLLVAAVVSSTSARPGFFGRGRSPVYRVMHVSSTLLLSLSSHPPHTWFGSSPPHTPDTRPPPNPGNPSTKITMTKSRDALITRCRSCATPLRWRSLILSKTGFKNVSLVQLRCPGLRCFSVQGPLFGKQWKSSFCSSDFNFNVSCLESGVKTHKKRCSLSTMLFTKPLELFWRKSICHGFASSLLSQLNLDWLAVCLHSSEGLFLPQQKSSVFMVLLVNFHTFHIWELHTQVLRTPHGMGHFKAPYCRVLKGARQSGLVSVWQHTLVS